MNDHPPAIPKGTACGCGASKAESDFFCAGCAAKLPAHLLESFTRCRSHGHFRELNRRAAIVLGRPLTRKQQKACRY
jgi:hypothetical protein